jgi:thymidylate synthase (FAD)
VNDYPTNTNLVHVLDHGFVRLVDSMGTDLSIVRSARVSYDAAWRAGEDQQSDEKLIRYLWKNQHTSPFEAVEFQFEVKAPIFVLRQWHRHRTWSYNELSARYREVKDEFYLPSPEAIGMQSKINKQARIQFIQDEETVKRRQSQVDAIDRHMKLLFTIYRELLEEGWPREVARSILPLATYSHMFAKVDLKNLLHFLTLRLHEHAQYEIRVYAEAMLQLIKPIVPVTIAAWEASREH